MTDPWDTWDVRVKDTGHPGHVLESLTNAELLNLLALERQGRRDREKEMVKEELLRRLGGKAATADSRHD